MIALFLSNYLAEEGILAHHEHSEDQLIMVGLSETRRASRNSQF